MQSETKLTTDVHPARGASFYHPVKRTFFCPDVGARTSMILERVYWDAIDDLADRNQVSWHTMLVHLLSTPIADSRNKCSYVRSVLTMDLMGKAKKRIDRG